MEINDELQLRLDLLQKKFEAMGQDINSYLDGLLYSDYLKYWDYIHLDTLLSLQTPRTSFPDEKIFIIYHQITELFFNMTLHALKQICDLQSIEIQNFILQMKRVNSYFDALTRTYGIMVEGMDKDQFLKFRMALLPASGFQSGQFRMIELISTDVINLVQFEKRAELSNESDIDKLMQHLYWKQGATELKSGKKTLTLRQFEEKYFNAFAKTAHEYSTKNIWKKFLQQDLTNEHYEELKNELRKFDELVNVQWPLAHFKSAVRYLQRDPEVVKATGGTNWQKYMPPKNQMIIFFPDLWSIEEKEMWGRSTKYDVM